jgi:hypothetical protein
MTRTLSVGLAGLLLAGCVAFALRCVLAYREETR